MFLSVNKSLGFKILSTLIRTDNVGTIDFESVKLAVVVLYFDRS